VTAARLGAILILAAILVAALPSPAHAWTPGTHVFLGDAVLRSISFLPDAIGGPPARIPAAFPIWIHCGRYEHREEVRARGASLPFVASRIRNP